MTHDLRKRRDKLYWIHACKTCKHLCCRCGAVEEPDIDEMKDAIKETQQSLINEYGYNRAAVNFPKLMNIKVG